jgi:hypothetical protein
MPSTWCDIFIIDSEWLNLHVDNLLDPMMRSRLRQYGKQHSMNWVF